MRSPRLAAPRLRRHLPISLALLLVLAACATERPTASWQPPVSEPSESPSPSPSPAAATKLTLAFGGDVHFTGRTLPLLDKPKTAFGQYAKPMRAADFTMVNLETAVTDRGTPQPKQFHFRAPITTYPALAGAGIDLVSLANNHALDYGEVGLLDTLDSARGAGMPVVGAGRNVNEAYAPHYTTVKGVKLGVVAFSQVHELKEQWKPTGTRPGIAMTFDQSRAVRAVKQASRNADVVIAYLHWGTEGQPCPNGEQKSFAAAMAAAGADVVVGTHAHMLLGDGYIGDTYVHYGLGNYLWYSTSKSTDTGLLTVTVEAGADGWKATKRSFAAGVVSNSGQPAPVTGSALSSVQSRLDQADRCAGLPDQPGT